MTDGHADVAAELWALADTVLTRLEPILRQAAVAQGERDRQGCSWCPVCAVAALLRGEQHDLLTLVASEGAGVIALMKQLLADHGRAAADHGSAPTDAPAARGAEADGPGDSRATTDAPNMPDAAGRGDAAAPTGDAVTPGPSVAHDTPGAAGRPTSFVPITVTIKDSQSDGKSGG